MDKSTVVVAMSGGVDSSVAAGLLVKHGYQVIGMMLQLWSESGKEGTNRCCTPDSMALARKVANKLQIPFYVIDAREIFYKTVVNYFVQSHFDAITPNPCILCNREIRWTFLLNQAITAGAEYLATGHYARITQNPNGEYELRRAIDADKDQSYVLYTLNQSQLARALFPIGGLKKEQVRNLALQMGLPVANRPESQDLCFLGGEDYRLFLMRHAPSLQKPGPILTKDGKYLGEHKGLAFYTIGQRKGIGVSSPEPLYVLQKYSQTNTIIVGTRQELGRSELTAKDVHWISSRTPEMPFEACIKIRYKAHEVKGSIFPLPNDRVHIQFYEPLRDITPGQAVVFYDKDVCLGGGIIET